MAAKYSPIVLYCRGSSSARSENVVARRDRTNACGCVRANVRGEMKRGRSLWVRCCCSC